MSMHLEQNSIENKQQLIDFIKSSRGGGGMAKCYPVSFIQGNFAHYHLY
jgi:hypothetical protein